MGIDEVEETGRGVVVDDTDMRRVVYEDEYEYNS